VNKYSYTGTVLLLCFIVGCICSDTLSGAEVMKSGKPVARVTVDAGKTERVDTPITVELPVGISGSDIRLLEIRN